MEINMKNIVFEDSYKVRKINQINDFTVSVPGSKSITNRALLIAALTDGETLLKGALFSDDSRYFIKALSELGFNVLADEDKKTIKIKGFGGDIPKDDATIYVGSAGTAARFLTAMLGLSGKRYTINASEQMKKRPMEPLFKALESLSVKIEYLEEKYHLPVKILGRTDMNSKDIELDISKSTQFLSAFLMIAVINKNGLNIKMTGERKTGSYIDITIKMIKEMGCNVIFDGEVYSILPGEKYSFKEYQIEPDASAACYFYAIAAITGCSAKVLDVHFDISQGDVEFVRVLEKMGCFVEDTKEGILVKGPKDGKLKGLEVDMKNFSDQALTLAAIAVFAESPVRIYNIGHIRLQESDRIKAISEELSKLGIKTDEGLDEITIYPGKLNPASIETYDDHRVAMSFTLIGLKQEDVIILNPACCKKTFEEYFEIIDGLYI